VGLAQLAIPLPLSSASPLYSEDRILIQPKPEISPTALNNFHAAQKVELLRTFEGIGRLQVLRVPEGETVPGLITKYSLSGLAEFAEPDYIRAAAATPN